MWTVHVFKVSKGVSQMKSLFLAVAVVLTSASVSAFATSTYRYNCRVNVRDSESSARWVYDFVGQASVSRSEGFAGFQRVPSLSVTKVTRAADGTLTPVTLVDMAPLAANATSETYRGFELPGSRYGLLVTFFVETGKIAVYHKLSETKVIESTESEAVCSSEEIG
jgi:hypothetical protein